MNREIKEKWVAALRSGEYMQGKRVLRINNSFCCLGVLCDLYLKAHPGDPCIKWIKRGDLLLTTFMAHEEEMGEVLPQAVMRWAGLCERNPGIGNSSLAKLNDESALFLKIADLIEKQL